MKTSVRSLAESVHSWDDIVSKNMGGQRPKLSASILNQAMMHEYGLDLYPHGLCGLVSCCSADELCFVSVYVWAESCRELC